MTRLRAVNNNYEMMTPTVSEHDPIFDDICNKLTDLSAPHLEPETQDPQPKYEQMQVQMKKFHTELKDSQDELREKIKTLGSVSYTSETMTSQTQQLADQLSAERVNNARLSADLAKSLELSLQLQLEIQSLKARSLQMQNEEKKYSHSLHEKNVVLQRDLDLSNALKDETALELLKAKNAFVQEHANWSEKKEKYETEIQNLKNHNSELENEISDLNKTLSEKNEKIESLHQEIENISKSFSEVENSAQQQNEVLKNLMEVAEGKIIEMKLAMDKKGVEAQDYYSHLQQALTQAVVLKQENSALKEYVAKLNYFHQQAQQAQQQLAMAQMAQVKSQVQEQQNQASQQPAPQALPTPQPPVSHALPSMSYNKLKNQ